MVRASACAGAGFMEDAAAAAEGNNPLALVAVTAATGGGERVPKEPAGLPCPRCDSTDTKFCYYNNYNLGQPRHFCKGCRRYWTRGGALRNVPVGGGTRARPASSSSSARRKRAAANNNNNASPSTTSSTAAALLAAVESATSPLPVAMSAPASSYGATAAVRTCYDLPPFMPSSSAALGASPLAALDLDNRRLMLHLADTRMLMLDPDHRRMTTLDNDHRRMMLDRADRRMMFDLGGGFTSLLTPSAPDVRFSAGLLAGGLTPTMQSPPPAASSAPSLLPPPQLHAAPVSQALPESGLIWRGGMGMGMGWPDLSI